MPGQKPVQSGSPRSRARPQAPLEQGAHPANRLGLTLTGPASPQMTGGWHGPVVEGAIEVGRRSDAGWETGQHDDWTARLPPVFSWRDDTRAARNPGRGSSDVSPEARLTSPTPPSAGVVICHPHPLYGGDRDNPVVVRAPGSLRRVGLRHPALQLRGVGASGGPLMRAGGRARGREGRARRHPGEGSGRGAARARRILVRRADCRARRSRDSRIARPGTDRAPARNGRLRLPGGNALPTLLVAGTVDPYCPPADSRDSLHASRGRPRSSIEGADHFFFGKFFPLGQAIEDWARRLGGTARPASRAHPGNLPGRRVPGRG